MAGRWTLGRDKKMPRPVQGGRRSLGDSRPLTPQELQFERLVLVADMVELVIREADGLPEPVIEEMEEICRSIDRVAGHIRW